MWGESNFQNTICLGGNNVEIYPYYAGAYAVYSPGNYKNQIKAKLSQSQFIVWSRMLILSTSGYKQADEMKFTCRNKI